MAANKELIGFLSNELQDVNFVKFSNYKVKYFSFLGAFISFLIQAPFFIFSIVLEHYKIHALIKKYRIQALISDSRLGLYTSVVPCYFLTHQLRIHSPYKCIEHFTALCIKWFCQKYTQTWIIDHPKEGLAGKLSKPIYPIQNLNYLGIISRFSPSLSGHSHPPSKAKSKESIDLLVLLSGPEPDRSIFEKTITSRLLKKRETCVIVKGSNKCIDKEKIPSIKKYNTLNSKELKSLINNSKKVMCRSGYSSLMDLVILKKPILAIPTHGQPEQGYLAFYHKLNTTQEKVLDINTANRLDLFLKSINESLSVD